MTEKIPFRERKVSTMTVVVHISEVNPEVAFWLLPWSYVDGYGKKNKNITVTAAPGIICSIASTCLKKKITRVRGMMPKSGKAFQHATTISMSIGKKFVSMKLSKNTIHICGLTCEEDIRVSTELLFAHLRNIKEQIDNFKKCDQNYYLEVVRKICKGAPVARNTEILYNDGSHIEILLKKTIEDNHIILPSSSQSDPILDFLLSYAKDYTYFGDYMLMLGSLNRLPDIFSDNLEAYTHETIMCNYNYNLGYTINKNELKRIFNGNGSFVARQNKAMLDHVTIELPYQPKVSTKIKRKRNKVPKHTFIVYRTGSVTQSGPYGEIAENAYRKFMEIISANEDTIKIL